MLATSWLYWAVPSLGNSGAPSCRRVLRLRLLQDLVELLLRDHAVADGGHGPRGDLVAAARGDGEQDCQQREQGCGR